VGVQAFPDLDQHDPGQYVLKYSRNINAQVTWVDIIPHLWSRVIKEGDEVRIFTINEPDSSPSEFHEVTPQPLITFRYDWYHGEGSLKKLNRRFATTLLPKTYEVRWTLPSFNRRIHCNSALPVERMHRILSSITWAPLFNIRSRKH
jgi:hypothetical protein